MFARFTGVHWAGRIEMMVRDFLSFFRRLRSDEGAQTSTEYILILSIAMSLVLIVTKTFLKPTFKKFEEGLTKRFQEMFFGSRAKMHHLKLGK